MAMIIDNVNKIRANIARVCERIGRDPNEIIVVGISKYTDANSIRSAVEVGIVHIGENRVQDARAKFDELGSDIQMVKHLVGHLQSNKAKSAVEVFDLIESVDSPKLARLINTHAGNIGKVQDILIQVNVAQEDQKSGLHPDQVDEMVKLVMELEHVRIRGLMTMAPFTEDKGIVRDCFRGLADIFARVKQMTAEHERSDCVWLSMGMSGDYETALEEGSNMVRIGRAIFHGE